MKLTVALRPPQLIGSVSRYELGEAVNNRSNIVLIGMPGAGKSTVGVILAKRLSWAFVDTDVLIQVSQGRSEVVPKRWTMV